MLFINRAPYFTPCKPLNMKFRKFFAPLYFKPLESCFFRVMSHTQQIIWSVSSINDSFKSQNFDTTFFRVFFHLQPSSFWGVPETSKI